MAKPPSCLLFFTLSLVRSHVELFPEEIHSGGIIFRILRWENTVAASKYFEKRSCISEIISQFPHCEMCDLFYGDENFKEHAKNFTAVPGCGTNTYPTQCTRSDPLRPVEFLNARSKNLET